MKQEKKYNPFPQCPFFGKIQRAGGAQKIVCESPVPGSSLSLYFRRKEAFEKQINIFCCEHYKKCEIYRMVAESKYEENNI